MSSRNSLWRQAIVLGVGLIIVASAMTCFGGRKMTAKPFVKWVGGKGQLIEQLDALLPKDLSQRKGLTYCEPFVGGGAMLFYMLGKFTNIEHAVVNDLNRDLITTYKMVKLRPEELITVLNRLQQRYRECGDEDARKAMFMQERTRYNERPSDEIEIASLFIFLNRTCFNGMYRVNSKGKYNVPFGKAINPQICDEETIRADSKLLQKVALLSGDFESVADGVKGDAFFYFDPPYRPLTQTASFTAYSKDGFGDEQQKRLAEFCRNLDKKGSRWLLSNSDPHNSNAEDDFFDTLYSGFDIHRVSASRMINSKADGRGKITELAIRNYKE